MKNLFLALAAALMVSKAMAADVSVSVSIGQPGFYGHIEIGNYGQPRLIYRDPVIIHRPGPGISPGRPLYLHVPPGHAKDWGKHCHKYDACGHQVYFVQEAWYNEVVVPMHRGHNASGQADHPGRGKGHGNGRGNSSGQGKGRKDD